MKLSIYLCISLILISSTRFYAIDNPHFYRATNMFLEPRLEHDYLATFTATLAGGNTTKGRSASNNIVPLLDIYGTHNIQTLHLNPTSNDRHNPYDILLDNLAQLPQRPGFATLSLDGSFSIIESNLSLAQNLYHGLLIFFHLPIRKLKISDLCISDLSPDDQIFPNKNSSQWQQVFQQLRPLLSSYGINQYSCASIGVGDLSSYIGWTHNYQETNTVDYIDYTLMAGFLAPTGKKRDNNKLLSLPTGYNGHWAFPLCAMVSIGWYEWVTVGVYGNSLFFLDNNQTMRLKTNVSQSGIIKLAQDEVSVHKGPLINTGIYFKADHVGHGFSVSTAYSFALQQKSKLTPKNPALFDPTIINSDEILKKWNMHTFNFTLEYDFTREGQKIGNRIGLFYNLQIAGVRTFNTNMVGGTYGLDISWSM